MPAVRLEVEQIAEEAAFFLLFIVFVRRVVGIVDVVLGTIASIVVAHRGWLGLLIGFARRRWRRGLGGAFD